MLEYWLAKRARKYRPPRPLDLRIIVTSVGLAGLFVFLLAFSLWALSLAGARYAKAHSWYHAHCCSGRDCAPVEEMRFDPTTNLLYIRTPHGQVMVPRDGLENRTYESQDARPHACIVQGAEVGSFFLRCLYLPPNG